MSGAVAALAVRDDFAVRRDTKSCVHRLQLVAGLVGAVEREVVRPLEIYGARNSAAAFGANGLAVVLRFAAGIDDSGFHFAEPVFHVRPCGQSAGVGLAVPGAWHRRKSICCQWKIRAGPGSHAAVEDAHIRVAEVFEEPERAGRAHAGVAFVHHHGPIGRHSPQREEVSDHPHEGAQWRFTGVDEAQAPEVQVNAAGQMAGGEFLCGSQVQKQRRLCALQLIVQDLRRDEHRY